MLEELRLSDVDGLLLQIDIPELQANDLSTAQAGAIGEHQHREEPERTPGGFRGWICERLPQYSRHLVVRVEVGRPVKLSRCSSNTIANRQDSHARIEPMQGPRDDAARPARLKEARR